MNLIINLDTQEHVNPTGMTDDDGAAVSTSNGTAFDLDSMETARNGELWKIYLTNLLELHLFIYLMWYR